MRHYSIRQCLGRWIRPVQRCLRETLSWNAIMARAAAPTAAVDAELIQIAPDIFRFQSTLTGTHQSVNAYVIRSADRAVVIDPPADLFPDALLSLGIKTVTDVLVTHLQQENAQGAVNFPSAIVRVPAGDEYLCQGPERYAALIEKWRDPWDWETRGNFVGNLAGAANERPLDRAITLGPSLVAGTTVAGLKVIATPGHGKNAVTLVGSFAGKTLAFCGDLIYGRGQVWNWFDLDWDYGCATGHKALIASARTLATLGIDTLCPTHGPCVEDAAEALQSLAQGVEGVFAHLPLDEDDRKLAQSLKFPVNFPEVDSPAEGFRQILPNLHQWREGNCAVLISKTGSALVVDDGLCYWKPMAERIAHHDKVFAQLKRALGIKKIELIIPSHYHGDHTENIPRLARAEGAKIISLDIVADAIEFPERYNLACPLPWYDTDEGIVKVDRRVTDRQKISWHEFELEFFLLAGQTYFTQGVQTTVAGKRTIFVGDSYNPSLQPEGILTFNDNEPMTRGWVLAIDKLIQRKPDLVVGGHGMANIDVMPALLAKRKLWVHRLREFKHLSARPDLRAFFDPFVS
jgi:glyoxylase-like metal-dependent hydrolase (beta-lactamase superfamily II)